MPNPLHITASCAASNQQPDTTQASAPAGPMRRNRRSELTRSSALKCSGSPMLNSSYSQRHRSSNQTSRRMSERSGKTRAESTCNEQRTPSPSGPAMSSRRISRMCRPVTARIRPPSCTPRHAPRQSVSRESQATDTSNLELGVRSSRRRGCDSVCWCPEEPTEPPPPFCIAAHHTRDMITR